MSGGNRQREGERGRESQGCEKRASLVKCSRVAVRILCVTDTTVLRSICSRSEVPVGRAVGVGVIFQRLPAPREFVLYSTAILCPISTVSKEGSGTDGPGAAGVNRTSHLSLRHLLMSRGAREPGEDDAGMAHPTLAHGL